MDNLFNKIKNLQQRFLLAKKLFDIEKLKTKEKSLHQQMSTVDFWQNQKKALQTSRQINNLAAEIQPWQNLDKEIEDLAELAVLVFKEGKGEKNLEKDLEVKYEKLESDFSRLEFLALFSDSYDKNNALLSIYAGVGGVDAQDWAQMLERMYLRFAERQGFKTKILDKSYGNEAGIKSVTLQVEGFYAYGFLKSENGVHRLLRNSPFNADGLRQTSFALVEAIPELEDEREVELKDEDLRFDVYRSSGPGGQSVNTTDSAVRIVHIESGITVSCQSERSQHQNKENALRILRAKLVQKQLAEKGQKEEELKGKIRQADWGRQIRSYFLYGNKLVKDHRSNHENVDVEAVLDGDIKPFMEAYLKFLKQ
jgi:peptide chain release factor 2